MLCWFHIPLSQTVNLSAQVQFVCFYHLKGVKFRSMIFSFIFYDLHHTFSVWVERALSRELLDLGSGPGSLITSQCNLGKSLPLLQILMPSSMETSCCGSHVAGCWWEYSPRTRVSLNYFLFLSGKDDLISQVQGHGFLGSAQCISHLYCSSGTLTGIYTLKLKMLN